MKFLWRAITTAIQRKQISLNIRLFELKDLWAKEHYPTLTPGAALNYEFIWKKIPDAMKHKYFLDLTWADWQGCINLIRNLGLHFYTQKRLKNLCGQLYKFAIRNNICERNYAPLLTMSKNIPVKEKTVYTMDEIKVLLANAENDTAKMVLILIFTGVRISEFLRINSKEDVFIDDNYLVVRRSKTVAGTNRPIPIHPIIKPYIEYFLNKGTTLLITRTSGREAGKPMDYKSFRYRYNRLLRSLNMTHTIHECRHTFASLLDDAGANDMCIRRMLGHAGFGVTKKVYTHKNLAQLFEAISLLKIPGIESNIQAPINTPETPS